MAGGVHWEALKGGYVDENQLREVVALDDDGDHSFSRQIVEKWFSQVEESLPKLKQHLAAKELSELSKLAHFVKGSSAALGAMRVKDDCEDLKQLGDLKTPGTKADIDEAQALRVIPEHMSKLEADYAESKAQLQRFYGLS